MPWGERQEGETQPEHEALPSASPAAARARLSAEARSTETDVTLPRHPPLRTRRGGGRHLRYGPEAVLCRAS